MSDRFRNPNQLPTKHCVACGREFTWRKKWARDWEQVRYCSDRCRQQGAPAAESGLAGDTETPFPSNIKKAV